MAATTLLNIAIVSLVMLLAVLLGVLAWGMAMQRQGLTRQRTHLYQVEESLELSRRGVENSDRLLRLAEQSVENQEEVIRLLKELVGRADRPGEAASGVRLTQGGTPPAG
jgi:hypothetical protein